MKKPFIVANVRDCTDLWIAGEISYSRMVEMLNEIAEKFYNPKKKPIIKAGFTTHKPGDEKYYTHC